MKPLALTLLVLLSAGRLLAQLPVPPPSQSLPVCNVRAFGARGDGSSLDTGPIKAAIAACAAQGGGTVFLGPGRYPIGTILLPSHTHLYLEAGAALVGSRDIADYLPSPPFGFARHYGVDITGEGDLLGMLLAKDATDITIDGQGEIDGQGDTFMTEEPHAGRDFLASATRNPAAFTAAMADPSFGPVEPSRRPGTMLVFFHCTNIRIHGITLRQAPNWTMHLQDVDGASLSGFEIINNPKVPNNDGIDCMMCRHVRITDCHIDTGDDDFAIVGSSDINVSSCSLSSRSAAIRLESTQRSTFSGLAMDTNRGIAIFGNGYPGQKNEPTDNVTFSDIVIRTHLIPGHWWGKAEPIYIAVQPCIAAVPCDVRVRNVSFNRITAEAEAGILLWGAEGTALTGIDFTDIRLHMIAPNPAFAGSVGGNLDLRWTATSPREGIVASDIPAFYARDVDRLRLRHVDVDWAPAMPAYFTQAIRVARFNDLTIDAFTGRQAQAAGAAIALDHGAGVAITSSRATSGTVTFLQLDAITDRRVFVNDDLGAAAIVMTPANTRFAREGTPPARPRTRPAHASRPQATSSGTQPTRPSQ